MVGRDRRPTVLIAGAGAAGLWTALALLGRGWPGEAVTLVEPDAKTADDHTWSYWSVDPLVPVHVLTAAYDEVALRADTRSFRGPAAPYRYYTVRSSAFYAFAKTRLAAAGVQWLEGRVARFRESATAVRTELEGGGFVTTDYALDSRPPDWSAPGAEPADSFGAHATLQPFGGWVVETAQDCFDPTVATLMDFQPGEGDVRFFYVLPVGARRALVELAHFSPDVWPREQFDGALRDYLTREFPGIDYAVREAEYGVIPMSDAPHWRRATARVWPIGTRGGWVQPSSGYVFARCERFGDEVAQRLATADPQPWRPNTLQQTFNAVMLGYLIERPERAGTLMVDLFERNGAGVAFAFLDERAGLATTLRVMWNSPRWAFTLRAFREGWARLAGRK